MFTPGTVSIIDTLQELTNTDPAFTYDFKQRVGFLGTNTGQIVLDTFNNEIRNKNFVELLEKAEVHVGNYVQRMIDANLNMEAAFRNYLFETPATLQKCLQNINTLHRAGSRGRIQVEDSFEIKDLSGQTVRVASSERGAELNRYFMLFYTYLMHFIRINEAVFNAEPESLDALPQVRFHPHVLEAYTALKQTPFMRYFNMVLTAFVKCDPTVKPNIYCPYLERVIRETQDARATFEEGDQQMNNRPKFGEETKDKNAKVDPFKFPVKYTVDTMKFFKSLQNCVGDKPGKLMVENPLNDDSMNCNDFALTVYVKTTEGKFAMSNYMSGFENDFDPNILAARKDLMKRLEKRLKAISSKVAKLPIEKKPAYVEGFKFLGGISDAFSYHYGKYKEQKRLIQQELSHISMLQKKVSYVSDLFNKITPVRTLNSTLQAMEFDLNFYILSYARIAIELTESLIDALTQPPAAT